MKNYVLLLIVIIIGTQVQAKVTSVKKRTPASAETCKAPQKTYRAFIVTGTVNVEENSAELIAPNGSTSESINCDSKIFSTIDVQNNETGKRVNFDFKNQQICNDALSMLKKSSKEFPRVVIIDKNCEAHIGY